MGITSCLGNTLEEVTESLKEAKSGIEFDPEFAELGIKSQVRGKPKLDDADFKELIPKASLRFCGTNAKYAYIAMDRAIQDSGLKPEDYEGNTRVAGILGQGGTSIPDIVETVDAVQAGGKRWKNKVGPFRVTRSMGSTVSAVLATAFKLQGPSYSISSACSTDRITGALKFKGSSENSANCGSHGSSHTERSYLILPSLSTSLYSIYSFDNIRNAGTSLPKNTCHTGISLIIFWL